MSGGMVILFVSLCFSQNMQPGFPQGGGQQGWGGASNQQFPAQPPHQQPQQFSADPNKTQEQNAAAWAAYYAQYYAQYGQGQQNYNQPPAQQTQPAQQQQPPATQQPCKLQLNVLKCTCIRLPLYFYHINKLSICQNVLEWNVMFV